MRTALNYNECGIDMPTLTSFICTLSDVLDPLHTNNKSS